MKELWELEPYSLNAVEKTAFLTSALRELSIHHYKNCAEYKKIIDAFGVDLKSIKNYKNLPFLPARIFKQYELKSVADSEIFKVMTSSGTSVQCPSKIFLDRQTSANQTKALSKIVSSFIGKKRLPMIIIDTPTLIKDRAAFSARGAGVLGFSIFGAEKIYALDENMRLDFKSVESFLEKHSGRPILLFGFTFIIWLHFYRALVNSKKRLNLSNAILFHGGGWKKLADSAVSKDEFKASLSEVCGIKRIHDYYGMVEQTGSIFVECESGFLHTPIFGDVIVRRANDWSEAEFKEEGILEVVSMLPNSYPGHIILSEDKGVAYGVDDCPCGRLGKYFLVNGRIKNAQIRGCSDTYEAIL